MIQNTGIKNQRFAPHKGRFVVRFDVTPDTQDYGLIGLSEGPIDTPEGAFAAVQFDPNGELKVLNGNRYISSPGIRYTPGTTYHFRFVINRPAGIYSVYITPPGSWRELAAGRNCRLSDTCSNVEQLDNLGVLSENGSISVSGLSVNHLTITEPVLFGTPEADAICKSLQVFPPDSHWNTDISMLPVLSNSDAMIESIGKGKAINYNLDMNFVFVPSDQIPVDVGGIIYPDECDPGPFPIPGNAPVENWPMQQNEDIKALPYQGQLLEEFQVNGSGDRHVLVIDPDALLLHEFWCSYKMENGWKAATAVTFNLRTNAVRPLGWTSADAAGLPIFPAVVRYDEVEDGMVNHAMRFTVNRSRDKYIYPATHFASRYSDEDLPRMGERFRLKQDFDISPFPPHVQAILKGLKKYGMFVADNGKDWLLSISPDSRIKGLETLTRLKGSDFEVVDTASLPAPLL